MICTLYLGKILLVILQNCLNFTRLTACEITYNNFEISLVVFMRNITTNHAMVGYLVNKPPLAAGISEDNARG